jgi:hypothetical protein
LSFIDTNFPNPNSVMNSCPQVLFKSDGFPEKNVSDVKLHLR